MAFACPVLSICSGLPFLFALALATFPPSVHSLGVLDPPMGSMSSTLAGASTARLCVRYASTCDRIAAVLHARVYSQVHGAACLCLRR